MPHVCEVHRLRVCCHRHLILILNDQFCCSRLRYSSFSSWCTWHIPEQQNISGLNQAKKLHACNTCRQAARICSIFANRVIAAEITLNCSTEHSKLEANAEFSLVCDDASDTTACSVCNCRYCNSVGPINTFYSATFRENHAFDLRFTPGSKSLVCPQCNRPLVRQARRVWLLFQFGRR